MEKLDDPDPLVRPEAAQHLADCCPKDHLAVSVLIERLRSSDQTFHDQACAAWALAQIGARASEVVPILLSVIEETRTRAKANELRHHAVHAIENLTDEMDVLMIVAQHCLRDRHWVCRMDGLFLAKRLIKRQPELLHAFVLLVEPLLEDEVEEIRGIARRVLAGRGEGV